MIKKIVLTGGPGSGKTTVIESIKNAFQDRYTVIVVDETATDLINMGIRPFGERKVPMIDFQELVIKMQLAKEEVVDRATTFLPNEDILIIYDRGLLDNCAYISEEDLQTVLQRLEKPYQVSDFLDRYDLVINLVSRKDFYTTENNTARSEDVESALKLGNKTLNAWLGHKNLKIVLPKDEISEKIREVLNHINSILEEKEVKRQEKYMVDLEDAKTDWNYLEQISKKSQITQTYLISEEDVEKRLRKTIMNGNTTYQYTVFKTLPDGRKIKVSDESLTEKMYQKLLEFRDPQKEDIHKTRYYFPYQDEYFTLDKIGNYGILERNVSGRAPITFPPFLSVIEKVTDNPDFQNKNIASKKTPQYQKK